MEHRHLDVDPATPVAELGLAALDDILDRGDLEEWRPLLAEVRRDPHGLVADRILRLVDAHAMQGTSELWRSWITSVRASPAEPALGPRLARLRRERGVTQQQLAERLAVTQPEISRLERRNDLKLATAHAYVRALGGDLELATVFERARTPL
jgi:DNA-binding XRE family transcriptional regulator